MSVPMTAADDKLSGSTRPPDVSFVMPCYNEEKVVKYTIGRLVAAFERAGHSIQVVAVDNGSHDRTGEIIRQLAAQNHAVAYYRVETNQGYGNGILSGFAVCTARWIGIIPADGQVDAEDVVRLYEAAVAAEGWVLAKVRRRFRMDGLRRSLVSTAYNLLVRVLWPNLGSIDVNGTPKILPRDVALAMRLQSKGWFLDPEILIKAHFMKIRILEFNVFGRLRSSGVSHVRMSICWEFLRNLLIYRFSGSWKKELTVLPSQVEHAVAGSCLLPTAGRFSK